LADRLKKSLSEIMELTTLEIGYWYEYLLMEQEEAKATMRRQKGGTNTTKHRRSR
jgi:hypothetical protein